MIVMMHYDILWKESAWFLHPGPWNNIQEMFVWGFLENSKLQYPHKEKCNVILVAYKCLIIIWENDQKTGILVLCFIIISKQFAQAKNSLISANSKDLFGIWVFGMCYWYGVYKKHICNILS